MKKKTKRKKPFRSRVLIPFNTGTRTILSKRDKARTRHSLNQTVKNSIDEE